MTKTWRGRVFAGVSLDGYLARTDSDLGWLTDPPPADHQPVTSDRKALEWETFYPGIDHLVMGRGTYEKVLTFGDWPYGEKPVLVLSSTLPPDDPRITVVPSLDRAADVLAERQAREVYVDGGRTVQSFLAAGLVDEITVAFAPVLLGSGLPLFGPLPSDVRLRLQGTHVGDSGMVHCTYTVIRTDDIPPVRP